MSESSSTMTTDEQTMKADRSLSIRKRLNTSNSSFFKGWSDSVLDDAPIEAAEENNDGVSVDRVPISENCEGRKEQLRGGKWSKEWGGELCEGRSHAGLFNLCIVVLVTVNSRLIIKNLMKYGWLIRAGFWFNPKSIKRLAAFYVLPYSPNFFTGRFLG